MFGAAMFDLSEKLLPKSLSISSITQLGDAESLVRVSGSQGMGHILAMALTMFPMATVLVVEGLIVQEGPYKSEFESTRQSGSPTQNSS